MPTSTNCNIQHDSAFIFNSVITLLPDIVPQNIDTHIPDAFKTQVHFAFAASTFLPHLLQAHIRLPLKHYNLSSPICQDNVNRLAESVVALRDNAQEQDGRQETLTHSVNTLSRAVNNLVSTTQATVTSAVMEALRSNQTLFPPALREQLSSITSKHNMLITTS